MSKLFIIVDGQVYLSAALVADGAIEVKVSSPQADIVEFVTGAKLIGSNGLELDFKTGEFRFSEEADATSRDRDTRTLADCVKRFGGAGGHEEILGYISAQISETGLAKDTVEKLALKEPDMDLVAEIFRQPSLHDLAKRLATLEQKLNSDPKSYSGS